MIVVVYSELLIDPLDVNVVNPKLQLVFKFKVLVAVKLPHVTLPVKVTTAPDDLLIVKLLSIVPVDMFAADEPSISIVAVPDKPFVGLKLPPTKIINAPLIAAAEPPLTVNPPLTLILEFRVSACPPAAKNPILLNVIPDTLLTVSPSPPIESVDVEV